MLKALRRWLSRIGPFIVFQLARTWRVRVRGELPDGASVVAFWHGDMLPVWQHFAYTQSVALVSLSRDGGLFAQLALRWRFDMVRGSSSKGGKEALINMVETLRSGRRVMLTPDGPRGPYREMKPGAIVAAHRAGVPLVLCRVSTRWAIRGTNWDRILIPLPLASIEVEFVTLDIPKDADRVVLERLNTYAENLLKNLTPLL